MIQFVYRPLSPKCYRHRMLLLLILIVVRITACISQLTACLTSTILGTCQWYSIRQLVSDTAVWLEETHWCRMGIDYIFHCVIIALLECKQLLHMNRYHSDIFTTQGIHPVLQGKGDLSNISLKMGSSRDQPNVCYDNTVSK